MADLEEKHCEPCEGGVPSLDVDDAKDFLEDVSSEWSLVNVPKINRTYEFADFVEAMEFVNEMAEIAEDEGHHPGFSVDWNIVEVTIWTHAVDGLTENDFILAAKLDRAAQQF